MTKTQKKLISTYRSIFPKETYKTTALRTQIQQTRLFRIFNGAEIKLSEFEILNQLIKESAHTSNSEFQKISEECSLELSLGNLNDLKMEMIYLLNLHRSMNI